MAADRVVNGWINTSGAHRKIGALVEGNQNTSIGKCAIQMSNCWNRSFNFACCVLLAPFAVPIGTTVACYQRRHLQCCGRLLAEVCPMDAIKRERLLNAAKALGPEEFNRLVDSVPEVRKRGRLRFWQEEMLAKISTFAGVDPLNADDFLAAFKGEKRLAIESPPLTQDDFFQDPLNVYWTRRADISPEWLASAWDANASFREGVTAAFVREASKNGDLEPEIPHLRYLKTALRDDQAVALYLAIRNHSPHREIEFRPAFERVFGRRMSAFPSPLTRRELIAELGQDLAEQLGVFEDDAYDD